VKLIVMDLDGTLLHSDKTISAHTSDVLRRCQEKGILTAFATARSEYEVERILEMFRPDIVISGGGSMVRCGDKTLQCRMMSGETVHQILSMCLELTGGECRISVTTSDCYYRNFPLGRHFGKYHDLHNFREPALKITAELEHEEDAVRIASLCPGCETLSYRGEKWRRFAAVGADKVGAIRDLIAYLEIDVSEVTAFGDDTNDIGMLRFCGTGIAMGNAIPEVKAAADLVIGTNDEDGLAKYLEETVLRA